MLYAYRIQVIYFSMLFGLAIQCTAHKASNLYSESKQMNNENPTPKHPQEPVPPFPYNVQHVTYRNETADITLAGTLTTPQAQEPAPAVILIAGMGAIDRDGMMYGHKLYLVLADYLTRRGIAVLRVDKRGVGASTGTFGMHVTSGDLADDVLAGIAYLKAHTAIDPAQIGLIGVSEGGMIASMLAGESPDVAFVVSMAGALANSPAILAEQTAIQLRADGASNELVTAMRTLTTKLLTIVRNESNTEIAEQELTATVTAYLDELPEALRIEAAKYPFAISPANASMKVKFYNCPWYRWILAQDMNEMLRRIQVPLLALYGERDFMAPHLMIPLVEHAMQQAHNKDYTIRAMPHLNHAFQTCVTGSLAEYATITETIAPAVLTIIGDWVIAHTRK